MNLKRIYILLISLISFTLISLADPSDYGRDYSMRDSSYSSTQVIIVLAIILGGIIVLFLRSLNSKNEKGKNTTEQTTSNIYSHNNSEHKKDPQPIISCPICNGAGFIKGKEISIADDGTIECKSCKGYKKILTEDVKKELENERLNKLDVEKREKEIKERWSQEAPQRIKAFKEREAHRQSQLSNLYEEQVQLQSKILEIYKKIPKEDEMSTLILENSNIRKQICEDFHNEKEKCDICIHCNGSDKSCDYCKGTGRVWNEKLKVIHSQLLQHLEKSRPLTSLSVTNNKIRMLKEEQEDDKGQTYVYNYKPKRKTISISAAIDKDYYPMLQRQRRMDLLKGQPECPDCKGRGRIKIYDYCNVSENNGYYSYIRRFIKIKCGHCNGKGYVIK